MLERAKAMTDRSSQPELAMPGATLTGRIAELEAQRDALESERRSLGGGEVLDIHPSIAELYRCKVDDLRAALTGEDTTRQEAGAVLRALIDKIILHPGDQRGEMHIELHGTLPAILAFGNKGGTAGTVMMVAEEGLEPPTRGL